MISRTILTITLGIFWFLYPPKAYAECSKCKAKVEWLRAQRAAKETAHGEITGWDANKTTWNRKDPSDRPINVKTKVSEVNKATIEKYATKKKEKEEAEKKLANEKEGANKSASNQKTSQ